MKKLLKFVVLVVILGGIVTTIALLSAKASPLSGDVPRDQALIDKGAYLAIAGDCTACHTVNGGKAFAGGLPMPIPMLGHIYASNITPDPETGIGGWSLAEFDRAVRYGIAKGGKHLYPAMPYVSYAKITDDDMRALYAYFKYGVAPVHEAIPKSTIVWPFNMRWPVQFWDILFAPTKSYIAKTDQSAEWNRGAYLVQGLAHCGTCHTPRGLFMQEKSLDGHKSSFLAGSTLGGWEAYNITSDTHAGIGTWSAEQLTQYLTTGNTLHAQAGGPMGEAVEHSFSKLSSADIHAMVTYIQSLSPHSDGSSQSRDSFGKPTQAAILERGYPVDIPDEANLYLGACASCHQANGTGSADHYYPSLVHNSTVGARDPNNLIQIILHGLQRKTSETDQVGMPGFASDMSDTQIAALTNYITEQFGNPDAKKVSASDVKKLRKSE